MPAYLPTQRHDPPSPPVPVCPPLVIACIRVRGHDLDFDDLTITVRDGKGEQDRAAIVPQSLADPLHDHLYPVKRIHEED